MFFAQNKVRDFAFDVSEPETDEVHRLMNDLAAAKRLTDSEQAAWEYLIANSQSWSQSLQNNPRQTHNWFQNWYNRSNWEMPE